MVKRIDITIDSTTSGHVDFNYLNGVFWAWLAREVDGLNNLPRELYKYNGIDIITKQIVKKTKNKKSLEKKKVVLEKEHMVELGGVFEEIGDKEDKVGGSEQKIGSIR